MNQSAPGRSVRIPVLAPGDVPLVSLQGEPHDGMAERLLHDITGQVATSAVSGVVIGIAGMDSVDSPTLPGPTTAPNVDRALEPFSRREDVLRTSGEPSATSLSPARTRIRPRSGRRCASARPGSASGWSGRRGWSPRRASWPATPLSVESEPGRGTTVTAVARVAQLPASRPGAR
ncbi:hypothetical protein ACGFX8_33540 [Streptomyces sp. NPDC048362]|uniref:hypothetical protein n=1 Tax=Streptomyces sp. NPDC048362 TaxID=3365539 RepID=UPI003713E081